MPPERYPVRLPPGMRAVHGRQRWLYGDTDPVSAYVDEQTRIAAGDLCWLHGHLCLPAGELALRLAGTSTGPWLPWRGQQIRLARNFLGVALQPSPIGQAGLVRVATGGVFQFECHATRAQLGGLVSAEPAADGTHLWGQRVILVSEAARAIGRVDRAEPRPAGKLAVRIFSRVFSPPWTEVL